MDTLNVITLFLFNIIVCNIALLYGTVGEIITEKSGSLNLGVEGIMAVGAIGGYLMATMADSLAVGILASFAIAGVCGLLFAFLTVTMQANQNVTGLTITTFGLGLFFFLGNGIGSGSGWPALRDAAKLSAAIEPIHIPGLSDIPVIGKALFSHNVLVYLGILIAILAWVYLKYTKAGLKLRAIGENPSAADAVGVNVVAYKYINIIVGAGIMGIGGFYMGMYLNGSFEGSSSWINGYGWIAVALVIFANWNPLMAILGTFVFGFFNTLQIYGSVLANAFPKVLGWMMAIPAQLYTALPFIITALILILNSALKRKKTGAPAAIGLNYYREER